MRARRCAFRPPLTASGQLAFRLSQQLFRREVFTILVGAADDQVRLAGRIRAVWTMPTRLALGAL